MHLLYHLPIHSSWNLQEIVKEAHSQITDDILEFLHEAYLPNDQLLLPFDEIPAALVVGKYPPLS